MVDAGGCPAGEGWRRMEAAPDGAVDIVPLDRYDSARAKIAANLQWICAKAYGIGGSGRGRGGGPGVGVRSPGRGGGPGSGTAFVRGVPGRTAPRGWPPEPAGRGRGRAGRGRGRGRGSSGRCREESARRSLPVGRCPGVGAGLKCGGKPWTPSARDALGTSHAEFPNEKLCFKRIVLNEHPYLWLIPVLKN